MPSDSLHEPKRSVEVTSAAHESQVDATATFRLAQDTETTGARATPDDWPTIPGFVIELEIARGGMGRVFAGRDLTLDREVAIKTLLPGGDADRFITESRITAQLPHPAIPPVYALGTLADGSHYLAMKLIRGRTLAALLEARSPFGEEISHIVHVFEQIAQAVGFAHSQGIIHRDLKPLNVMVGEFGEVQVMDWGLARRMSESPTADRASSSSHFVNVDTGHKLRSIASLDTPANRLTTHGQVLGTPAYMPPEQARGEVEALDERSDVFGLGAILCEILTGSPPYEHRHRQGVLQQAAAAELAGAYSRLAACGADAELIRLATDCLAPKPADRPANASEVARRISEQLRSVQQRLRQAEISAAAAEAKAVEAHRRRRVGVALLASLVLLAVTIGGASAWYLYDRSVRVVAEAEQRVRAEVKRSQTEQDIVASLDKAERTRLDLLRMLGDPEQCYALMNHPESWRSTLTTALLSVDHAQRLIRSATIDSAIVERMSALKSVLQSDMDDHEFAVNLESIRSQAGELLKGKWTPRADLDYQPAFADSKYAILVGDETEVAKQIQQSPIAPFLIAALDHWVHSSPSPRDAVPLRVLQVLQRVDPDMWRNRVRDRVSPVAMENLQTLADECDVKQHSPQILLLLAERMRSADVDPLPFLRAIHLKYPSDYWVNLMLGQFAQQPADQLSYLRAALALRPKSSLVYGNIGAALSKLEDMDGAIVAARRALELDPRNWKAQFNLGLQLYGKRDLGGAIDAFRKTIAVEPGFADAHYDLGVALRDLKDHAGAIAANREAIRLRPEFAEAHCNLGLSLREVGQYRESLEAIRRGHELGSTVENWPHPSARWLASAERFDLLDRKMERIFAGEESPADPSEQLEMGKLLFYKGDFTNATRFYAEAFRAEPAQADNLAAAHRYMAACCAARAIAAAKDDTELAHLLQQARTWLQADFTARTGQFEMNPGAGNVAKRALQYWQSDRHLEAVREEASFAVFPADEQAAWRQFWSDVAALIERIDRAAGAERQGPIAPEKQ